VGLDDSEIVGKMKASKFLKKGEGQGGGIRDSSSPLQSRDKGLFEDLKAISQLNKDMREVPEKAQEVDFGKRMANMLFKSGSPQKKKEEEKLRQFELKNQKKLEKLHDESSPKRQAVKFEYTVDSMAGSLMG